MTNANPNRAGLKQGGSDATELFLGLFGGEVLTAYHAKTVMRGLHTVKALSKGKEFRFPLVWKTNTSYHTPGKELLGNTIAHQEVIISPDDKLVADVFIPDIDEVMNHFDLRGPYAEELARALAKSYDQQVIRAAILAARASAQFSGGFGGTATNAGATVATDATKLYDAILDAKLAMDDKEVDVDGTPLNAILKPAQHSLLARSEKFINRDTNGGAGSVAKFSLTTVDGINIVKAGYANGVFGTDNTNTATIPSTYRADFSNTVAVVMTPQAVATAEVQGVSTESEYQVSKQGTLMVARQMTGTRTLRPEAAVEIKKGV